MHPDLPIDHAIAGLAAKQRGHLSRHQLLALGLGPEAIKYRLRTGRLHKVYLGVYAVGHRRPHPMDRAMAAVLACGPGAVLSHSSAASLWGFFKYWDEPFEVTLGVNRRPKEIRVHHCHLTPADRTRQEGIPVTSPGRTLLDCAPKVANPTRLVNDALHSPWLTESQLVEASERHSRGRLVRRILFGQAGLTRSELEDKFVAFCKRFGIKLPELNVPMNGRVVDAFFREEGVIIELDGYDFHKDRATFERDRDKDAEAIAGGLITVRITESRLTQQEACRLTRILESRRR
jgi:hypothetical protein